MCNLPQFQFFQLINYPDINISREFNSHISRQDHLILPVKESIWKKCFRLYFEENSVKHALVALLDENQTPLFVRSLAQGILNTLNAGHRLKMFFSPHMKEIRLDNFQEFSQIRQYDKAAIRFMSYNQITFKLAVAGVDDSIRIYSNEENGMMTLLKHGAQKSIMAIAWRKFSCSCIVVGCQTGFLVWNIDPNSNITRPLSQAVQYRYENHFPVTSLEFNPNGTLLATASINDSSILIWDIDKSACVPLRRTSVPYLNLQWSLNGAFMFSSTVGNIFRIWDTETWKSERWTIANGRIQSFQWSPCSRFLLFVTSEDPILYSLGFADEPLFNESKNREIQQPQRALPVADLSKITLDHMEAGGLAQQIAWNGKYLAISFKDTNSIAIFQTSLRQHQLHILPMFFIAGLAVEFPTFITFQPNYKKGSSIDNVLTIAWSSGRIQFFPFV